MILKEGASVRDLRLLDWEMVSECMPLKCNRSHCAAFSFLDYFCFQKEESFL